MSDLSSIDVLAAARLFPAYQAHLEKTFRFHDRLHEGDAAAFAEVAPRIRAVACGGESKVPGALIERLPALEIISVFGVGYDGVDVATAGVMALTSTPLVASSLPSDLVSAMRPALLAL